MIGEMIGGMIGDDRALLHLMGIARNKRDDRRIDAIKAIGRFNMKEARE